MKEQRRENTTRWWVYDDGLRVWVDGELVAVIDPGQFKYLMAQLAQNIAFPKNDGS